MNKSSLYVGLMSGTSADGIDAALVKFGDREGADFEVVAFETTPYPEDLRQEILRVSDAHTGTVDRVCRLDAVLGEWFARAAEGVISSVGVGHQDIAAIGSHGQTVHHLPEVDDRFKIPTRASLQIGNPSVISERTGIVTVSDFRSRDLAVGGQGAPLIPIVDYLLFRSEELGRVLLNIGGIANVTVLPARCGNDEVLAFDTGPGNCVIDGLVSKLIPGRNLYDNRGEIAASGKVDSELLSEWMNHPFLELAPPKSTGREMFGGDFVDKIIMNNPSVAAQDLLATATAFTAQTIVESIACFASEVEQLNELFVSGGGGQNLTLMRELAKRMPSIRISVTDELGLAANAKEAVAFALLAHRTLNGLPGNIPSATGASRSVVLGQITPTSSI